MGKKKRNSKAFVNKVKKEMRKKTKLREQKCPYYIERE